MPPRPCFKCKSEGNCNTAGLICRLAIEAWLDDKEFPECPFKELDYFHGVEGVFA